MSRRLCNCNKRRFYLTGWLHRICTNIVPDHSLPVEGCQAPLDGVVASYLHQTIPLLWRGGRRSLTGWLHRICTNIVPDHSPPVEGWQAQPDGVVASWGC